MSRYLIALGLSFCTAIAFMVIASGSTLLAESSGEAKNNGQESTKTLSREALLRAQPTDVVLGDKDAPVTVVEYASLSCGHCASFHNNVFPTLHENYIKTGNIQFIYRDFPLNPPALRAAQLARCAGDDKFHSYIKVMFDTQRGWAFGQDFLARLREIAILGGMKGAEFDACMQNQALETQIITSRQHAEQLLGVSSTPTLFVNGEKVEGAVNLDRMRSIIAKYVPAP